ncbi:tetratricopeptide repeat protein [Streptomyces sp. H62]
MSRLGREEQRDHEGAEPPVAPAATPIEVRVPAAGPGARSASVDGAVVVAAPGEEIQNAVLNRLHRLALAVGAPVLATIHDERIGCSVPLRVDPDGSSHLAAEPVPTGPAERPVRRDRSTHVLRAVEPARDGAPTAHRPTGPEERRKAAGDAAPTFTPRAPAAPAGGPAPGTAAAPTGVFGPPPRMDGGATATGTAHPRPAPGPAAASGLTITRASAVTPPPVSPPGHAPASAFAPTPTPAPVAWPEPVDDREPERYQASGSLHVPEPEPEPTTASEPPRAPAPAPAPAPVIDLGLAAAAEPAPRSAPTPARGFDAVAEAVLGDGPLTAPGDATAPSLLAEPTGRINEAVKEGRTEEAARLAEQTVAEASTTLGPEHPEVLRLRELSAYIAYLSGDPDRAFHLSMDLARIHRRAGDAEAAYGNVRSAATAWRAVRDPERGLELGRELVGLWSELADEEGPAADDAEELRTARNRMGRLTERARAATG